MDRYRRTYAMIGGAEVRVLSPFGQCVSLPGTHPAINGACGNCIWSGTHEGCSYAMVFEDPEKTKHWHDELLRLGWRHSTWGPREGSMRASQCPSLNRFETSRVMGLNMDGTVNKKHHKITVDGVVHWEATAWGVKKA